MTTLKEKFNPIVLEEIRDKSAEIQILSTSCPINSELLDIIDHLTRVVGMYSDVVSQELKGHIETSKPQSYIEGKFSIAYSMMKDYYDKEAMKTFL